MRVPFPESSARDPSAFQIARRTVVDVLARISRTPSVPSARADARVLSSGSVPGSTTRYVLPRARQVDDRIHNLLGWAVRIHENDAWDPPHPLALVRGVAP